MADSSEAKNQNPRVKKGDYTVHVFLEEARGLSNKGDDTLDVVFKISTFNDDHYSQILDNVSPGAIVSFNEHFFFDKSNVTVEEFESTNIRIECKNHKMLLKDTLVGIYEMDLTYVYKQKDHCIRHQWVALSNPQAKGFSKVRGYIKLGISVTHESDSPADLTLVTNTASDSVILPPQVVPQTSQLKITLLKAENLPVMDSGGTLDAYIEAHFSGCTVKSSVQTADEATMSAYWYEEMLIPVMEPCVAQRLVLKLWDKDTMSLNNDLVGSFNFDWDEILDGKYIDLFWANIYGAPPGISNDSSAIMNNVAERASHWRGRVLLKLEVERNVKQAVETVQRVQDPEIEVYVRDTFEVGEMYELRAQVFRGHAFPKIEGKYSIIVSWSSLNLETSEIKTMNGCVDWYENLKRKVTLIPYKADSYLPDVFIYLKEGDDRISYIRYKVQESMNIKDGAKWFKLFPDQAVGKVQNTWQGGFVKLRVYVGKYDAKKDTIKHENWNIKPVQQPASRKVLLCHLFQCKNLPACDNTGLSDPYVQFYYVGNSVSTGKTEKQGTLNPVRFT